MAREGWCPIATANGGGSAFIEFYGIPNTYEHLCIRGLVSSDSSDSFPIYYYMYFNTTTSGYDVSSNSTSYAGGSRDTQANFNGTASPTAGRNTVRLAMACLKQKFLIIKILINTQL